MASFLAESISSFEIASLICAEKSTQIEASSMIFLRNCLGFVAACRSRSISIAAPKCTEAMWGVASNFPADLRPGSSSK
jgi:hypothetical protein